MILKTYFQNIHILEKNTNFVYNYWMNKAMKFLKYRAWRLLKGNKYERLSNNIRENVSRKINLFFNSENDYIYFGYGTVLLFHRDNNMKNQDLDIVISRELYESDKFKKFIKSLNCISWQKFYFKNKMAIHKYILNGAPIEFFIIDLIRNKEIGFNGSLGIDGQILSREIKMRKIQLIKFKNCTYRFPTDISQYVSEIYGPTWIKKIPIRKFTYKNNNQKVIKWYDKKYWNVICS